MTPEKPVKRRFRFARSHRAWFAMKRNAAANLVCMRLLGAQAAMLWLNIGDPDPISEIFPQFLANGVFCPGLGPCNKVLFFVVFIN